MSTLPPLHGAFSGYAAIFACIGVGLLFLRSVAGNMPGPGFWAVSFFLNSVGFLCWAETVRHLWWFFGIGDFIHVLGFVVLIIGIHKFFGLPTRRWHRWAVPVFVVAWLGGIFLLVAHMPGATLYHGALRGALFLWIGTMVWRHAAGQSPTACKLAWGLWTWGGYSMTLSLILKVSEAWFPFAFGLLVGFEVLVAIGLVVVVLERLRLRAESSEHQVRQLERFLPICAHCKKIRDEQGQWHQIEQYIHEHSDTEFSHGVCPDCLREHYADFIPPQPEG